MTQYQTWVCALDENGEVAGMGGHGYRYIEGETPMDAAKKFWNDHRDEIENWVNDTNTPEIVISAGDFIGGRIEYRPNA